MLFGKKKEESNLPVIRSILDAQDTHVIIADKDCKTLLMNNGALDHLADKQNVDTTSCKGGYSCLITDLCTYCPNKNMDNNPEDTEIQDVNGAHYSVRYRTVSWAGDKPVTAIFLRDISTDRMLQEKLYSLAYVDQLTNIANRRKLKEDFDAIEARIAISEIAGTLVIFDVDHFKTINDSYGHNIGDIMLKRLTSYFESEEAFRGHLYRLGGDEFVLFYSEPANRFKTQRECQDYYHAILKETLRTYTLPNIESHCTLSIGVSLFPWHGHDFSDLLRKADIALYKAKERGRNQICFFEEAFDSAQKLKDIFISILPVLDKDGCTHGYELVDHSSQKANVDNSLNLNEFDRTMETLGLDDLNSDTLYFISYSNQLLNHAVAKHLPVDRFVVQIDLTKELNAVDLKKCLQLRSLGYSLRIAGVNKQNLLPEILELANYCSFDPDSADKTFRNELIAQNSGIQFIATDVHTVSLYEHAKGLGFSLFQGYYFSRPNVVKKTKEIDQLKINYLRLLSLTSMDDYVDFHEISEIISSDVALTYKLLRILNSAAMGLRHPISSIKLAITYLGEVNLKKWIAILAVRGVSESKPMELIRLSLIRAQFGELLCEYLKPKRNQKHVFLTGLLSLLDVALEKSKEDIFKEIMVADEIRDSLLTKNGPHSDLVAFFSAYEFARWEEVSSFSSNFKMSDTQVNSAYVSAVSWYNTLLSSIKE